VSNTKLKIDKVLNKLRGALGTDEDPHGSNHNFITEWYNKKVAKIGNGPWCEMTNTWCMWEGGAKAIKVGRAYTVYAVTDAIEKKLDSEWHWGTKGMRAGDQVYYDWSGKKGDASKVDHTGTVEKILGDGTFYVLEGNTSGNRLQRMRRDKRYVVGYARFNWDALPTPPKPKPADPPAKPKPDPELTKRIQQVLEVRLDGQWGPATDGIAQVMRTAARAHAGYPHRVNKPFPIMAVQRVIDTTVDNEWGPRSQASMSKWVKQMQHALRVQADGQWGPKTDNAYLAARKKNHNNY
jgi:hypothetical protein